MHKVVTSFFLFLAISLISFVSPVSADYQTAYQDYVFNLQQYKSAHSDYQIAKSTYQTYRTLTSQNDAVGKFKNVLKARNQVMSTYYDLLQEKMNATEGVSDEAKKTFNGVRESEKNWLSQNQSTIDAAESLQDLNTVSSSFEQRYPQMNNETKRAIGTVLVAKEVVLRGKYDTQAAKVSTMIDAIRSDGEDTTAADRGLISIQSKLNFQTQKTTAARSIFEGSNRSSDRQQINLLSGQKALIEANQYLKESAAYLLEIVRSYTG